MIERPGTYAEVAVDTYLRDSNGVTWYVADEKRGWLLLKDRQGRRKSLPRPPQSDTVAVTILEPTEDEAVRILSDVLGAEYIATLPKDERVWKTRFRFPQTGETAKPGDLAKGRSHLWILHRVYANDVKSVKKLIEIHNHEHDHAASSRQIVPHTHPGGAANQKAWGLLRTGSSV